MTASSRPERRLAPCSRSSRRGLSSPELAARPGATASLDDQLRRNGNALIVGIFYKMRQNDKSNRALTKHLADQDPDRIMSENEACRILGISRPTLYRHGGAMPRIRLSPGRVGYRVGDLLKFLRASAEKHVARTNAGTRGAASRFRAPLPHHDVSDEEPGIVEPVKVKVTPDTICGSVAGDPDVREADARLDRATPSTHRNLVHARLAAQARAGIAPEDRAPLHSAQVEEYLLPIIFRMGQGDEQATVAKLRSDLRRLYGEYAETVLSFMLRTYRHGGTEALLEAAMATAAAA
jgi:predicted DNA-binding transcriptional regulator AlpA